MDELIWGLTAGQWSAIAAVGSVIAALGSLLTALVTRSVAKKNFHLTRRIHRESGPLPILTVWRERSTKDNSHVLIARVENGGRTACEVSPPVIDQLRNGRPVVVDPYVKFTESNKRVKIAPSEHIDWSLDVGQLTDEQRRRIVWIHVDTRASGGGALREKVLLGDSHCIKDRIRLLLS